MERMNAPQAPKRTGYKDPNKGRQTVTKSNVSEEIQEATISAEETKKVFQHNCTVAEFSRVKEISDAWTHFGGNWETREGDWRWDFYCLLSTVYAVGRIQGIRDERKRNKERRNRYANAS